jgi:hypothetical protein
MEAGLTIDKTKHVVHISTNITTGCAHCKQRIGGEDFAESVNHYLEKHGYKLLHVGSETTHDSDGGSWHSTVAIVGKT